MPISRLIVGAKSVSRKLKRKRSKALIIMLLPALIFIGIMGWLMYTLGNPEKTEAPRKSPKKDNVTLLPIIFEEQHEIKSK